MFEIQKPIDLKIEENFEVIEKSMENLKQKIQNYGNKKQNSKKIINSKGVFNIPIS